MNVEVTQENSAPAAAQTSAATPEAATPDKTSAPAEAKTPLTPGEAAKEARINAELAARKARLKKQTDAFHAEKQAFATEKEMTAKERKETAEKIETLQKELHELRSGNPLLREPKEKVQEHLRELVAQGTPEAEVIALKKRLEQRDQEFEAWKKAQEDATKARKEEEERRLAEIQKTQEEGALRQFTLWVTSAEMLQQFKYLNAEYTQSEIAQQAAAIVAWAKKENKGYTGLEIADYLESVAKKRHDDLKERRAGLFGAPPPATDPAVSGLKAAPPVSGKKAPVQVRQKSKEEEIEADLAALRRAAAADAAARAGKK